MDKLANLKRLHDSGALSDDDYAAKKAELLSGDVEQVHHTGNDEPDVNPAVCTVVDPAQLSVPTGAT